MDEDVIFALIFGFAVILGVAGITLRLALKPIVDSVARLMQARAGGVQGEALEQRIGMIERDLENLRHAHQLLLERQEFQERLKQPEL